MRSGEGCPVCGSILRSVSRFQYAQDIMAEVEVMEDDSTPATTDIPYECILKIEGLRCDRGHIFATKADPARIMVPCPNPRCRSFLEVVKRGKKRFLRCEDYGNRCSLVVDPIPTLKKENRDQMRKEVQRIGWNVDNLTIGIPSTGWFRMIAQSDDHIKVSLPPRKRKRKGAAKKVDYRSSMDQLEKDVHVHAGEGDKGIIMNMIETLDNISRAVDDARKFDDVKEVERMLGGLEAIRKGAVQSLKQRGIEVISPAGEKFDPHFQEAVGVVVDNEIEQNRVVKVELEGYIMNGKLLRPAMVLVSKHGKEETLDWDEEDWES